MKKTFLFALSLVLVISYSYGQKKDSILYAAAYEYIKNDSLGRAYRIIPTNNLIRTSYISLGPEEIEQCNIHSLRTVTSADINRIPHTIREYFTEKVVRRLAHQDKLMEFDLHSMGKERDTLSYVFPPIMNPEGETNFFMHFSKVFNNEFFVELDNGLWPFGMSYFYYFRFDEDQKLNYVNCFFVES